jgi:hypothetical protein
MNSFSVVLPIARKTQGQVSYIERWNEAIALLRTSVASAGTYGPI